MPHVLKPLSEEEVHEQSKIITSDKMKKKVHRKREERERDRECMISVSVQNIKHHLTRVLIHIRNKEKTWKSFSRHFNFAHKYMWSCSCSSSPASGLSTSRSKLRVNIYAIRRTRRTNKKTEIVKATATRLEASDFELLQKLGKISISTSQSSSSSSSSPSSSFSISRTEDGEVKGITASSSSANERVSSAMVLYAARWSSGEPLFRYPGDPLVSLTGPQVLIKEYLPSVKVLAETEVNAYERLLADDRPDIDVDEYGRGKGQMPQKMLPIVRCVAYFAAGASESEEMNMKGEDTTSFYVAQEWVGLKRLSEYASAMQKDDGEGRTKFWPPVEMVQTHPTVLRFRYIRSAIRQTARAVAFCHANGVAHNGVDAGTFFCDSFDDRDAFEERGEFGTRFRLANFGAAILDPSDEDMARDVRALGKVWAEVIFSALAREGPSVSTKSDALTRQFETLFNFDFDGQIWEYLEAEPNYDVARYFLKEKFGDCDECVWEVLRDAWLCDVNDENFAVTAAALARRIERIASEADRVARGEIERETQTIKVKLPPFVSERLESVAQKLDDTIVQDPTLPDIPKPDWFTGQGEYSEGIWSDRIGKDYKEQIRNITPDFLRKSPKDDEEEGENDVSNEERITNITPDFLRKSPKDEDEKQEENDNYKEQIKNIMPDFLRKFLKDEDEEDEDEENK